MAKALAEFKKEFEDIKKLVPPLKTEIESLTNNLKKHADDMHEGVEALGVEVAKLRHAGVPGRTLDDFMGQPGINPMVRELQQRRDAAKQVAAKLNDIRARQVKPIIARVKALITGLTTEIAARNKAVSSKALGLNQSVKEMEPLLTAVTSYSKTDVHYKFINAYQGANEPAHYDKVYTEAIQEELDKSHGEVMAVESDKLFLQLFNDRVTTHTLGQATTAMKELNRQSELARAAQKARDINALAGAKKAAGAAMHTITTLAAPYEKGWKDRELVEKVKKEAPKSARAVQDLLNLVSQAESELGVINGRTMIA
jgi:hypothetical protein